MNYNVDYFINKFKTIPEHKWIKGNFERNGNYCANGYCGVTNANYKTPPDEAMALAKILQPLRTESWSAFGADVPIFSVTVNINDGFAPDYPQPTPKQRILAALYDIKKLQGKDNEAQQPKERIVYVAVPATITEQAKELIEN